MAASCNRRSAQSGIVHEVMSPSDPLLHVVDPVLGDVDPTESITNDWGRLNELPIIFMPVPSSAADITNPSDPVIFPP